MNEIKPNSFFYINYEKAYFSIGKFKTMAEKSSVNKTHKNFNKKNNILIDRMGIYPLNKTYGTCFQLRRDNFGCRDRFKGKLFKYHIPFTLEEEPYVLDVSFKIKTFPVPSIYFGVPGMMN